MNREAKEGRHLKRDFFYCSGEMLFLKDGDGKGRLYLEKMLFRGKQTWKEK